MSNDNGFYKTSEQETTCAFDYELKRWIIYSSVRRHMTKLMKQYPDSVEILERNGKGIPIYIKVVLYEDLITFRGGKKGLKKINASIST